MKALLIISIVLIASYGANAQSKDSVAALVGYTFLGEDPVNRFGETHFWFTSNSGDTLTLAYAKKYGKPPLLHHIIGKQAILLKIKNTLYTKDKSIVLVKHQLDNNWQIDL